MGDQALICASCGAALKAGAKFCSKCGAKVIEKRYCGNCGAELDAGDRFCSVCGAPVGGGEKPAGGGTGAEPGGQAALKVINDSGYYCGFRPVEGIHVNTPDYYFFVPPNTQDKGISRIDQNMKGKSTRVHNEYDRGSIVAMSIVDGALAVLIQDGWDEDSEFYLEYFTVDLEYIRGEPVNGLLDIDAFQGTKRFLMNGSCVFEIIAACNGQEDEFGDEYMDCKVISYNILSGHSETRPLAVTGAKTKRVGGAWLHQSNLYIALHVDQKDEDGDDCPFEYLLRVDTERKTAEIITEKEEGWPLFFDFDKDIMWTYLTDAECRQLGLTVEGEEAYLGARKIKRGAPLLAGYPFWKIADPYTYTVGYFDGEFMFETPSYHIFYACTQSGDRIEWPGTGHGKADQMFVWNGKIIGDLHANFACFYHPKQLQYTEGIKIEGIEGF